MKPYTLSDKLTTGIHLEGGENGYVPHLVLGRTGSEPGLVMAVNKNALHTYGSKNRLLHNCAVTKLEDGRLEIVAGDDHDDKRLLVHVQSGVGVVRHALSGVEVLVRTDLTPSGSRHSLVVVGPGDRIPMTKVSGTMRHVEHEYFEFWNNDGVPEIVPKYSLPEAPKPAEPVAETQPAKQGKNTSANLVFWLGLVVGFVTAHAMHLLRPM